MSEYKHFLPDAVLIAEQAASVALSYFRKTILIETKEDSSPVTIADKKSEETVRNAITQRYPEHGILGEEFGEEGMDKEFVWTIDPIDGTRSFIRGIPLFGTLLGLMHRRRVVLGVMVLPALGETYSAAEGTGTECNGKPVHVSKAKVLESSMVACGDVDAFERAGKTEYMNRLMQSSEIVRGYTDCFGHSLVLRGAVDAMIDPVVAPWDVIPIACLVKEAGGTHFNFSGTGSLEDSSFITSSLGLQKPLLAI